MIRKYVSAIALSLSLIGATTTFVSAAVEYPNENPTEKVQDSEKSTDSEVKEEDARHKCKKDHKDEKYKMEIIKEDVKMLTSEANLKLLSDDDKKSLEEISKCISENKELSKDHIKVVAKLKDKVIKAKLGDKDYKKFKELIKKDKKGCITEDEMKEAEEFLKKIYCK